MKSASYRAEIDGLRAVSVVLIVLFHLHVTGFRGGFVGVDVFFVISGFLITGIILGDLNRQVFTFRQFYIRRITRIIPALLATVFFSLLAASILFMPAALVRTAEQGIAAVFSVSNIYFWMELDYWSPSAKNELLLHTWSLGVEEQFYLFYPLLLVAAYRYFSRAGVILLLFILVVGGTMASETVLHSDSRAAFFLTPLRIYEFALGGLVSLVSLRTEFRTWPGKVLSSLGTLMGLLLILFSAVAYDRYTTFPGVSALTPTGGAMLIILAGASPVATILLANPLMNWIGKMSYSLYLVHWPLIVFYRTYYGSSLTTKEQLGLLAATVIVGTFLNYSVERRLRLVPGDKMTKSGLVTARALWGIGLATILICVFAITAIVSHGWPGRIPASVRPIADIVVRGHAQKKVAYVKAHCKPQGEVFCGEREEGARNIMLLADSRGLDIYIAIKNGYPDANVTMSYGLGCAPLLGVQKSIFQKNCSQMNHERFEVAKDAPSGDVVFLAMNLNKSRAKKVVAAAKELVDSGKQVYVLGESQFIHGKTPRDIAVDQVRFFADDDYIDRFLVEQPFGLDEIYGPQIEAVGATYISTRTFFYEGGYRIYTREGTDLLSYDGLHLSKAGAREFGEFLAVNYPLDIPGQGADSNQ